MKANRVLDEEERSAPIRPDLDAAVGDDGPIDQTPPPDHEGWVEACKNGLRAIRERHERRRRKI